MTSVRMQIEISKEANEALKLMAKDDRRSKRHYIAEILEKFAETGKVKK